jgi:hypothetical protein
VISPARLRRLASLSPGTLLHRVRRRLASGVAEGWLGVRDRLVPTLRTGAEEVALRPLLDAYDFDLLEPLRAEATAFAAHALEHRFDLLGSGWVRVEHGMPCRGLEGHFYPPAPAVRPDGDGCWLDSRIDPANRRAARRVWRLVEGKYQPIDWAIDFRSGFRWRGERRAARLPNPPVGADVKVPWELARMQHLPQLAWSFMLGQAKGAEGPRPEACRQEFRNQVLDFIAANPPRFGVNWASPMDVAIRAAGWALTWSLFHVAGARFDEPFLRVFAASLRAHVRHVAARLEWDPETRGNHYLACVSGMAVVAAALSDDPETDAWLGFGARALVEEVDFQFHPEGTHFEGSTGYHRLAAEMVVYASAVLAGVPEERLHRAARRASRPLGGVPAGAPLPPRGAQGPFPDRYLARIAGMSRFVRDFARPDGCAPQIGDTDSGRFFRSFPRVAWRTVAGAKVRYTHLDGYAALPDEAAYPDVDHLDHGHLRAAVAGLLADEAVPEGPAAAAEAALVRALAGGRPLRVYGAAMAPALPAASPVPPVTVPAVRRGVALRAPGGDLREGLRFTAAVAFGLYLFRSHRLYLVVRCGAPPAAGGAHAHNDQLGVELWVDGAPWLSDPGTYVYTPLPERRNAYRSVHAHSAPPLGGEEPSRLGAGLFHLPPTARARCLAFGEGGFVGELRSLHGGVRRAVRLTAEAVEFHDEEWGALGERARDRTGFDMPKGVPISPGYGMLHRRAWSVSVPEGAWHLLDERD